MSTNDLTPMSRQIDAQATELDCRLVQRMAEITRAILDVRLRRRANCATIGIESNPELRPVHPQPHGTWHY
jgi:hypothetical protein